MTAEKHEIPSDDQVIGAIQDGGGSVKAPELMGALIRQGYTEDEVVRAIQRTLDRGKVSLGKGLELVVVSQRAEAA